jgi:hypothetical protein
MIDASHCSGCRDDFYNGNNQLGVNACWLREKATLVPRLIIHVDQTPPYLKIKPRTVPNCYKAERHVTVKPESIGSDGYWK